VDIRRSDSSRAVVSTYHAVEENVLSSQSVIDSHSEQISYRKDRIDNDNHDKGLGRSQLQQERLFWCRFVPRIGGAQVDRHHDAVAVRTASAVDRKNGCL
jgi:hypothetical protein